MERAGLDEVLTQNHTEAPSAGSTLQENTSPRNTPVVSKQYSRTKLLLGLSQSLIVFVGTIGFLWFGLSQGLEATVRRLLDATYGVLLGYAFLFGVAEAIVSFPLRFISGFYLEHRYGLSNQTFGAWLLEGGKASFIGSAISVPIILALFWCIRTFGGLWWIPVGSLIFLLSVVLARVAPVLLFPLFHKFEPMTESPLRERVVALCEKVGMRISGVFVFDLSKNTKKANAAFTGIGKSRRIILGDTLVANFTDEEIETVVAHELGHYKLHHLRTMIVVGMVSTFAGLYVAAELYVSSLGWFGFSSPDTIAALPLLGLWLGVYSFVTTPLSNALSRMHERAADRFAVDLTGMKQAFSNALTKLGKINLADTAPHPVIEFLFHSHPSIQRRIGYLQGIPAP